MEKEKETGKGKRTKQKKKKKLPKKINETLGLTHMIVAIRVAPENGLRGLDGRSVEVEAAHGQTSRLSAIRVGGNIPSVEVA